jgi:NitT/TauT family transport system permease protein/sulfonate transport system permease protein
MSGAGDVKRPRLGDRQRVIPLRLGLVLLLLAIWQIGSLGAPSFILPGPARVWHAWLALVASPSFLDDLGITSGRVCAGFAIAAISGTILGLVLGASPALGDFFEPVLSIVNTVSSSIWAIFALMWFGLSNWATIFVVFMTAMPLILTNVWEGTRTVNADFLELARTFRMPRGQVLLAIYLPTILPLLFSGARLAFGFGARVSLVAEALGASSGIGYRLRQAADLVQTDQVFAWTLTLVALMLVVDSVILKPLEWRLFAWRKVARG